MAIDRAAAGISLALVAWLAGCATSPPVPDLPTFLERRAMCDHFRGEFPDPPDPERAREIEKALGEYCTGIDAQLARLKKRYKDDAAVTKQLAEFETPIESK